MKDEKPSQSIKERYAAILCRITEIKPEERLTEIGVLLGHPDGEIITFNEAFNAAEALCNEVSAERAVGFAEWLYLNYEQVSKGVWLEFGAFDGKTYTTSELYALYLETLNKQTSPLTEGK